MWNRPCAGDGLVQDGCAGRRGPRPRRGSGFAPGPALARVASTRSVRKAFSRRSETGHGDTRTNSRNQPVVGSSSQQSSN